MLDPKLLAILVCPVTKGPLRYNADKNELVSIAARLAYPIDNGFPVLLEDQARELSSEELEQAR